jgi:hypothetical protein
VCGLTGGSARLIQLGPPPSPPRWSRALSCSAPPGAPGRRCGSRSGTSPTSPISGAALRTRRRMRRPFGGRGRAYATRKPIGPRGGLPLDFPVMLAGPGRPASGCVRRHTRLHLRAGLPAGGQEQAQRVGRPEQGRDDRRPHLPRAELLLSEPRHHQDREPERGAGAVAKGPRRVRGAADVHHRGRHPGGPSSATFTSATACSTSTTGWRPSRRSRG